MGIIICFNDVYYDAWSILISILCSDRSSLNENSMSIKLLSRHCSEETPFYRIHFKDDQTSLINWIKCQNATKSTMKVKASVIFWSYLLAGKKTMASDPIPSSDTGFRNDEFWQNMVIS